ncbi:protein PAM71, chloroplastic isoform X4 [Andrographis paniculata]|uniref:protein PAM71, chloroplastic isoform X4 n=1 Tax=Andrographis paniculata TaxID=175694 RepID=UPI0021E88DD4|nr:protein PAM71, chloroplastic isoform X4 [Andrographis paniculata]
MAYALSGPQFTITSWTTQGDDRNDLGSSFIFTPHFQLLRNSFAGKSSYGPQNPFFMAMASKKELRITKEKCHKLTSLHLSNEISDSHENFTLLDKKRKNIAKALNFRALQMPLMDYLKLFAFLLIFFSELGDKTFFIAALLAARNSAAVTFIGTFSALALMTIISVLLGRTFHYIDGILPFRFGNADLPIDDLAAVCLLIYFGVSSLIEASSGDDLKADEEQKEAELAVSELSGSGAGILAAANTLFSTFLLVFVAEWGDKSFFSTIALAAAASPLGVIAGAFAGHGVATLLAVLGGSFLGTFLSEKAIRYIGGILFLVFAAVTFVEIVN